MARTQTHLNAITLEELGVPERYRTWLRQWPGRPILTVAALLKHSDTDLMAQLPGIGGHAIEVINRLLQAAQLPTIPHNVLANEYDLRQRMALGDITLAQLGLTSSQSGLLTNCPLQVRTAADVISHTDFDLARAIGYNGRTIVTILNRRLRARSLPTIPHSPLYR